MQYNNDMTGIISKNTLKEKENQPDIRGECEINGQKFWISGWRKVRKDGSGTFHSLVFQPKDKAPARKVAKSATPSRGSGFDDMQDDVPW